MHPVAKVDAVYMYQAMVRLGALALSLETEKDLGDPMRGQRSEREREGILQRGLSAGVHRSAKILAVERLCAGPGMFRPARVL